MLLIAGQQVLRSFSSIRASVRLHDGMITSLLWSPLSFFHKTPQVKHAHTHTKNALMVVRMEVGGLDSGERRHVSCRDS